MEKKETFKIKRETLKVSEQVKEQLKQFNAIRRHIMEALGDEELTIPQIAEKVGLSNAEAVYYVMSLVKFNKLVPTHMDDMDEFYFYKIKK